MYAHEEGHTLQVLRVGHINIGDNIYDTTIGFLRKTFVLTTVTGFHVEDRYMKTLGSNNAETAVGVAKNEYSIWLCLDKELI